MQNNKISTRQELTTCLSHHPGKVRRHVSSIRMFEGQESLSAGIIIEKHRPWRISITSRTPSIRNMTELEGNNTHLAMRSQ